MKNNIVLHRTEPLADIVKPLLRWYRSQARDLPWRENPSPYHVWISEIMLQQTRVEAVKPYFARFTAALPDVRALAGIATDDLLKLWKASAITAAPATCKKAAREICQHHAGHPPGGFCRSPDASGHRPLYGGGHQFDRLRPAPAGRRWQRLAHHHAADRLPGRHPQGKR